MTKNLVSMLVLIFIGLQSVFGQGKEVTGRVTSAEDGKPIPGVTVLVKGTTNGTITDANGNYTINVPSDDAVLVFSFIGMQTIEVSTTGKRVVKVLLSSDTIDVDEVVVTALGITRSQKSIGYASSTVKSDELTKTRSSSVMEGIAGKVAGVQISSNSSDPGASSSVIIRGVSSLGGSNQPLYVINGVPMTNNSSGDSRSLDNSFDFGNGANLINPDDVENVTILKGAAATALYGSRAANGVILIKTKTGKGKASISFNSSIEMFDILRLPKFQNSFGMGWDGHHTLNENGSWGPRFDGKEHLWGNIYNNSQKLKKFLPQKNNLKDFFEIGKKYNNSISLSGGDANTNYFSSLSMINHDGLVPGESDSYKKYTGSFSGSHKIGDFKISSNVNYSQQENKFAPTGQGLTIINSLYQTPRDISIVSLEDYKTDPFDNIDYYYTPYGITNPYYLIDNIYVNFKQKKVFGKMQFDYAINNSLNLMYRFGIDVSDNETKIGLPEVRANKGTPNENASTNQEGSVKKETTRRHQYNHDFLVNYKTKLKDIKFDVTAGLNANESDYSFTSASVTGLDIPGFYDLSNSSKTPTVDEYYKKRRLIGLLANAEISYKDMLFLSLSARNDWSSTLPKENNSFFYSGATLSFLFTELLSQNMKKYISYGKVRLAYGQTGNDASPYVIDPYFIKSEIYNPFRNLIFPLKGINAFEVGNSLGNTKLQPEITTELEAGFQFKFFNNRLGIDFAYYDRTSNNQIYNLGLAPSTGYTSQTTNLGEISNKGFEILLDGTPIKTNTFSWKIGVNYSENKNELVSLPKELGDKISIGGTSAIGFVAKVGKPIGLYELPVASYTEDNKIIVNEETGRPIPSSEKMIIEKADFDFTMGINNVFTYKNLSLSFDIDIRNGGLMYSRTADINYFVGNAIQTTYNDRNIFIIPNSVNEVEENGKISYKENITPIALKDLDDYFADGGDKLDEAFLIPRSFVKLKRASLSYTLPKKWLASLPISNAVFTVYGNNLLLFTPARNSFIDPEVTSFGNDLRGKYGEYTANPSTRSLGFNLKLNF